MELMSRRLKIGIAVTRRDSWNAPQAFENSRLILEKVRELSGKYDFDVVTTEHLTFRDKEAVFGKETLRIKADTLLTDYEDALVAARYFKQEEIDALFIPFCNFGQEEAVAKLAGELSVPTLIWGPRDEMPDGLNWRPTDTQCGLFAASKVLMRYHVKFTYIENCRLNDPVFEREFAGFLGTARIVAAFKRLRILQISVRPQQFLGVMINEAELLEKYHIEIVPVTATELFDTIRKVREEKREQIQELVRDMERDINLDRLGEKKETMAAVEIGIMELARRYRCTSIASECWHEILSRYDLSPCFLFGDINDRGIPCACELDIHAAVTAALAVAANGYTAPSFTADLTLRHPQEDNTELLWHCGPFAKSLREPSVPGYVTESGQGFYPLKKGVVTVLRFDGADGEYRCFAGCGESVEGPVTNGNYVWLKVDDWVKWEKKFIYGPYIHHVVGIFGDFRKEFEEACRYLDLIYDNPDIPERKERGL